MAARLATLTCMTCRASIPYGKITCPVCKSIAFGAPRATDGRVKDGIWRLSEVTTTQQERIVIDFADLNWGPADQPGMALTSVTLLAGMPGAGKSTFCAQLLSKIALKTGRPTLYVGAEESGEQVKDRATRLELSNLSEMLILPLEEQSQGHRLTPDVFERWRPSACVVDSAQRFSENAAGAVELAESVKDTAVRFRCPFIIISQVNKEEEFAGLNAFQHAADALMIFSLVDELVTPSGRKMYPPPDPENVNGTEPWRILLTKKNRNGPAGIVTYFTMHRTGLKVFTLPEGTMFVPPDIPGDDVDESDEEIEKEPESGPGIAFDEDGPIDPEDDEET